MPAITVEQRQYQTYILTNSEARLEVVPERGGIVTSWQVQNQEMFYLDTERFTHPDLSVRGGIPILFPICGNLPDDSYSYGGQSYKLKQHGFARELPWQAQETTTDQAALTLVLESNPQTLETYPFEFQLAFTYELQGRSLLLTQRHSNRSDRPMPISTGLHPYFTVTDKSQLEVEIPASHYQEKSHPTPQPFAGFDQFARKRPAPPHQDQDVSGWHPVLSDELGDLGRHQPRHPDRRRQQRGAATP